MSTPLNFIEYVCDQLGEIGDVRYKKMFGEYMVYVNDKPVILVCDSTVYVKKLDVILEDMRDADCGFPYDGAKEHYVLDIDDREFANRIVSKIESVTPIPKKKSKK